MASVYKMMVKQARSLLIGDFYSKSRKEKADAKEASRVLEELGEKPLSQKPPVSECVPPMRRLLTLGDSAIGYTSSPQPNPQPLHSSKPAEDEPRIFIRSRL